MSGFYGRRDPADAWNEALSDIGGAFANTITRNRKRGAEDEQAAQLADIFGAVAAEERGARSTEEPGAPVLIGEAKGKGFKSPYESPRDMVDFLDRTGRLKDVFKSGALGTLLSMSTGRPAPDEDFVPMDTGAKAEAAKRYNIVPEVFQGGWEWQPRSGHVRQVAKPLAAAEMPEAPKTRTITRGDQTIEQEWTGRGWRDVGGGPRWAPERPKEGPEQFDTLTAAEKAAIEQAAGLPEGRLADVIIQRNRETGRLHGLPGELDALAKLLLGAPKIDVGEGAKPPQPSASGLGGKTLGQRFKDYFD